MNGSLPPELDDTPFGAQMYQDLMAEQEAQKPSFGERLAADPFFQMGAAILGAPGRGGNFMAAVGQGMSQGLQAAQAAEDARRETQHNQIRNRLWMEQLNNERFRLLGGEQPTPFEQGQMQYWEGQNAVKMRELDLRERGVYESGGGSSEMEPWGILGPDGSVRYESVPKGQVPRTAPDERLFNARSAQPPGIRGSGLSQSDQNLLMVGKLNEIVTELEGMGEGIIPVGTLGAIGAKLSAYAGIVDQIFKTDFHKKIVGAYGGKDPALIRKELMALTLPIIRTLVEPKGPISGAEQGQGQTLLGINKTDPPLSGKQAIETLKGTSGLASDSLEAQGAKRPGTSSSSATGLSPEEQAELERLRKQQGNL